MVIGSNPIKCVKQNLSICLIFKIYYLYFMFPIFGILLLLLIPSREEKLLKIVALNFSCFSFIGSLIIMGFFSKINWFFSICCKLFWLPILNLNFTLGIDGISFFFFVNYIINSFMYYY
jgi:NADH:ubiquinone oxidoreductase subunit 4 (subunit M)